VCIVIAVLNGIKISHKLFTPEMVVLPLSIHDCESVLGMERRGSGAKYTVQMWTRVDGYDSAWFPVLSGVRQGCEVALHLFPIGLIARAHGTSRMVGTSVGSESFLELDFANDMTFLTEMLSLLILALEKHDHSASPSTGQRPRFRPCLTPHPWATRLQLMVTV